MKTRYRRLHLLLVALVASVATWALSRVVESPALAQGSDGPLRGATVVGTQIGEAAALAFVSESGEIWLYTLNDGNLERHYRVFELGRDLQKVKGK